MRVTVSFKNGPDYEIDSLEKTTDWIRDQVNKDENFCKKLGSIRVEDLPRGVGKFIERREIETECGRKSVKLREDYSVDWRVNAIIDGELKRFEMRDLKDLTKILKENPSDVEIEALDGRAEDDLRDLLNAGLLRRDVYIDDVHVKLYI